MDWILRILLHHALSRYWLSQRKLAEARHEAVRLCELAGQPRERTYLALSHLLIAETAIESEDWNAAEAAITESLRAIEGANAPLAEWRVCAAASKLYAQTRRERDADRYRQRALEVLTQLADSLEETDRLRLSLLASPIVQSLQRGD
jgi:hypothetical protein